MLMQDMVGQGYGTTGFGVVIAVSPSDKRAPNASVGEVIGGVDLKLSEGDERGVAVKSPV
jgi:malonyl-CoA/methylmalonyl-CoA synthetase